MKTGKHGSLNRLFFGIAEKDTLIGFCAIEHIADPKCPLTVTLIRGTDVVLTGHPDWSNVTQHQ